MTNNKYVEIEIKFPLRNAAAVKVFLVNITKESGQVTHQIDTYYNSPTRDFLAPRPVSEWLRIRRVPDGAELNYKNWHKAARGAKSTEADEFETFIGDPEALAKLLRALGFKPLVEVDKIRHAWNYHGTEIAIDEVRDLGSFVEIEAKGEFPDKAKAKERLYCVLREIKAQVGAQDYQGYPYLLLKKTNKV